MDSLAKAVERLRETLGPISAEPVPLAGGITNRNFRACFGADDVVIRLPGKDTDALGIDREAERAATEMAADAGVGPEVIALFDDPPCLVTRFIEGDPLSGEQLREEPRLAEVAAALREIHGAGDLPVAFDAFRVVQQYAERAAVRGVRVPDDFAWAEGIAVEVERAFAGDPEHRPVPCHNDLLAANFLATAAGVRIVDWEYAGMGDPFFDFGNLAVNNELGEKDEEALLAGYFEEPPTPARLGGLRLMRFMSDFREAMWGVLQGSLSDLEFDFASYASEHFARLRTTAAEPSFASSMEAVGAPR